MKQILLTLILLPMVLFPMLGCPSATVTTPPAALAPGYSSQFDQTAGQSLAAAHALVVQASADYQTMSATQQAKVKPSLNAFIQAVNGADTLYLEFHAGAVTQADMQKGLTQVSTAQANYTTQAVR